MDKIQILIHNNRILIKRIKKNQYFYFWLMFLFTVLLCVCTYLFFRYDVNTVNDLSIYQISQYILLMGGIVVSSAFVRSNIVLQLDFSKGN